MCVEELKVQYLRSPNYIQVPVNVFSSSALQIKEHILCIFRGDASVLVTLRDILFILEVVPDIWQYLI